MLVIIFHVSAIPALLCPPSHQNRSTSFILTRQCASHDQTTDEPDRPNAQINLNFFQASRCPTVYFRHWVHGYGCMSLVLYHHRKYGTFDKIFPSCENVVFCELGYPAKINSRLQIAQSSVPNPLQALLVMIYSARTKDISRTPEYIFWQSFQNLKQTLQIYIVL